MADIQPFRGLRYDEDVVGDIADVITPPYDIIDEPMRRGYAGRSPFNFVHIDLPQPRPDDEPALDRYEHAAKILETWRDAGAVSRDDEPALYVYEQVFDGPNGQPIARRGFVGLIRLHDYEDRVVLPHERTHRGPKEDRLALAEATDAQLSQIFLLYEDAERRVDEVLRTHAATEPTMSAQTSHDGVVHRLWKLTDRGAIETIQAALAEEQLLIADGHHRYETAVALRDRRRAAHGQSPDAPWEYTLAFLANTEDPGLIVLPTHRGIHGLERFSAEAWLESLEPAFELTRWDGALDASFFDRLAEAGADAPSFGVALNGSGGGTWLAKLDPARARGALEEAGLDELQRKLDVSVLHDYVLTRLTGLSKATQAAKTNIDYYKSQEAAVHAAESGSHQAVVFLNPPDLSVIRAFCASGGVMPQKSTYFYPKIASGLVLYDLST